MAAAQPESDRVADTGAGRQAEEAPAADAGSPEPGGAAPAEAADGAGVEAEAEPAAAPATEELSGAERDVGLQSIAESGGGAEYGGSGGGAGGGGAVPDAPEPPSPAVPADSPEAAMAAVATLPPAPLAGVLGQVSAAASANVSSQRVELQASPPELERPSGSPVTRNAPAPAATLPAASTEAGVRRAPEGAPVETPAPTPLPAPAPPPTQAVATPAEPGDVQAGLRRLPTRDPGLEADAGPAPALELAGNADPARAREQRAELEAGVRAAEAEGARDLVQPMGEDGIYPVVPRETLRATTPSGGATAAGGAAGAGPVGAGGRGAAAGGAGGDQEAAVAIVAQQERGADVRAATAQAQAQMAERRQEHAAQAANERANAGREVARLEGESAAQQSAVRESARGDVAAQRAQWGAEQRRMSAGARAEADVATEQGRAEVSAERAGAERQARAEIEAGNHEAGEARRQGEAEAARERARGEQEAESGGVFGWLRDRARAFFDGIKRGIQAAFERARSLVRAAVVRAKQAATAVIERARRAVVAIVRRVGDALIAIGGRLLAGFPAVRERFQRAIRERVAAAEAAVNRLAERLRAGVLAALDLLGAALDRALGLLERGLVAAVDGVNRAVNAAIDFARSAVAALAAFAALVRDVAGAPGQWVRNLGAAVVDGIRNHLWRAFKEEVRGWFNSKLEAVLGLGTAVWGVLTRGGISMAHVGRMAFDALKAAIPTALIQLLIEKLVSMIVPAAGAVMAIVEGLQAAWGTVSRVIASFGRFFAFLRAVKAGGAGPQFASALASAAVVVIEFVANWLLRRLMRPARAVGARVRAIAQRIMARLRRVGRRVGGALRRAGARVRGWFGRRGRGRDRRTGGRQRALQQRLDRAVAAIRPLADRMLANGVSPLILAARLLLWRLRYRLSSLYIDGSGELRARVNPESTVIGTRKVTAAELGQLLLPILRKAESRFLQRVERLRGPRTEERAERARAMLRDNAEGMLPQLSRVEQVILLRDIRRGAVPVGRGAMIRFGDAAQIQVQQHGRFMGRYVVQSAADHKRYPRLIRSMRRLGNRLKIDQGRMHHVISAPTEAELRRRLSAVLSSARGTSDERGEFMRMCRSAGVLTQALEAARAPGQVPVAAVASELAARGQATTQQVFGRSGQYASMSGVGATAGAEHERRQRLGRTLPTDNQPAVLRRMEQRRAERRRRIGSLFARLINAARSGSLVGKQGQIDLSPLAAALERWLELKLGQVAGDEDALDDMLRAAERTLRNEFVLFLRRYHARGNVP
jgi:hypothetical protein